MKNTQQTAGQTATDGIGVTEVPNMTVEVLSLLARTQQDCAKIDLSIGATSEEGQVVSDVIIVKECPPIVIEVLRRYLASKEMTHRMSVELGGLYIDCQDYSKENKNGN